MVQELRKALSAFIMLILPYILLASGMIIPVSNVWYFVLAISWFGLGLVFFVSVE